MKKTSADIRASHRDDLKPEYAFDYHKARENRFAGQADTTRTVVVLDAELSAVFATPDAVNKVLRALVKTMPKRPADTNTGGKARRVG